MWREFLFFSVALLYSFGRSELFADVSAIANEISLIQGNWRVQVGFQVALDWSNGIPSSMSCSFSAPESITIISTPALDYKY